MPTTSPSPVHSDGEWTAGYGGDDPPLGGYLALASLFSAGVGVGVAGFAARDGDLPERIPAGDIVLLGLATHKVSRLLTKDRVTAFLRAPFTRYQESAGHGEVEEAARGTGVRRAIGELLICPYCVGQWVAGAFVVGYIHAPRATRLLAALWTTHAIADAAQLAYVAAESRA